jgi:hypothetical protein
MYATLKGSTNHNPLAIILVDPFRVHWLVLRAFLSVGSNPRLLKVCPFRAIRLGSIPNLQGGRTPGWHCWLLQSRGTRDLPSSRGIYQRVCQIEHSATKTELPVSRKKIWDTPSCPDREPGKRRKHWTRIRDRLRQANGCALRGVFSYRGRRHCWTSRQCHPKFGCLRQASGCTRRVAFSFGGGKRLPAKPAVPLEHWLRLAGSWLGGGSNQELTR